MRMLELPKTDLTASQIVLGLMRIADLDDEEIRTLVGTARDAGITFLDHADIYGGEPHTCERRFGDAMRLSPADREQFVIQSKVGIRRGFFDFSREHILSSVDASLEALRTDHLDVLLLHRPDALVEPDEVAAAFDELHDSGKVRRFGVSNHTPGQIELLQRSVRQPLAFDQVQLSIAHASLVAQGIAANIEGLPQSASRDVGLVDYARLNDVTLQAWSPVQAAGTGVFVGDREHYADLNERLDELAGAYGVTPDAIAIAWITRHPARIQVVLGTTRPERVRDQAAGADIELTRQEWYGLFRAAGYTVP